MNDLAGSSAESEVIIRILYEVIDGSLLTVNRSDIPEKRNSRRLRNGCCHSRFSRLVLQSVVVE